MADLSQIQPHMEIFGADGVRLGTVDSVEGGRVRLSANADNGALLEEEADGRPLGEQSVFGWRHVLRPGGLRLDLKVPACPSA